MQIARKESFFLYTLRGTGEFSTFPFATGISSRHTELMKRILFVCLGNICRSPTAEAVFQSQVEQAGRKEEFELDSAGTIAAHAGSRADSRMREHAAQRGYKLTSISRKVTPEDFTTFTHIFAMDGENLSDLQSMAPKNSSAELSLFLSGDPQCTETDVPDPYYGGPQGFETVLDLVESACTAWLNRWS